MSVSEGPAQTTPRLSRRVARISPSPTMAVMAKATHLKQAGEDVVDFSAGQPDFDTPDAIKKAGMDAIDSNFTRYTVNPGMKELRSAVVARYETDFGLRFDPEECIITNGGKHALLNLMLALIDTGDEVVIPTPYWATFGEQARLAGGEAVLVPTSEESGFQASVESLRPALGPRTRMLLLNVPANPTGVVPSVDTLRSVTAMCRDEDFYVLWDDTYAKLMFDPLPTEIFVEMQEALGDRLIVAGTASKAYAMTGWRLGWALASKPIISACASLQSQMTSNASSIAQKAGLAAMTSDQSEVVAMVDEYRERAKILYDGLTANDGVRCVFPGGGFYLFPNISKLMRSGETATDFATELLNEERVAVVPGPAFGHDGHLRVSFACSRERIAEGIKRFTRFAEKRAR